MVDCVLVTGGCGYIGSHTVLALLEQGYIVYIIDSHKNSNALVIKRLLDIFNSKNINLFQKLHLHLRLIKKLFFQDIILLDSHHVF